MVFIPVALLRSLDQRRASGSGWGSGPGPTSAVTRCMCLFLLQLLPLTLCLLAASLFAAPPHRLPLSTSWGPS